MMKYQITFRTFKGHCDECDRDSRRSYDHCGFDREKNVMDPGTKIRVCCEKTCPIIKGLTKIPTKKEPPSTPPPGNSIRGEWGPENNR